MKQDKYITSRLCYIAQILVWLLWIGASLRKNVMIIMNRRKFAQECLQLDFYQQVIEKCDRNFFWSSAIVRKIEEHITSIGLEI